jgi:GTP-binding protein HflX
MSAVTAFIPYKRNDLVALWHQRGVIDEERYEAEGTHIAGRLPQEVANQLAKYQVAHDGAGSTKS